MARYGIFVLSLLVLIGTSMQMAFSKNTEKQLHKEMNILKEEIEYLKGENAYLRTLLDERDKKISQLESELCLVRSELVMRYH